MTGFGVTKCESDFPVSMYVSEAIALASTLGGLGEFFKTVSVL